MCGIAGWVGDADPAGRESAVRDMCDAMVHRGPDDSGFWSGTGATLGMRRLSIIDLAGGHQPVFSEDRTVVVVFNGEIYNFRELRTLLETRGHRFSTQSDTEVIVHGYEEFGDAIVERLRGMFSIAVWDVRKRRLLLAVDHAGIKPLYYAEGSHGVLFASELKCLMTRPEVDRAIDDDALAIYFGLSYIPAPYSIYSQVRKLCPGTLATFDDGVFAQRTYWDLPLPDDSITGGRALDERVESALDDAVKSHLVADVPVGAFLSGGLDSGTVVALMARHEGRPVGTYTVGFDSRSDERALARCTAERYRTDHHEFEISAEAAMRPVRELVAQFDEPFADSSAIPTYHVCEAASRHGKVCLSGDGGDELFVGYTIFLGLASARLAERVPSFLRRALLRSTFLVPRRLPRTARERVELVRRRFQDATLGTDAAFRAKVGVQVDRTALPWLGPDLERRLAERDPLRPFTEALGARASAAATHYLDPFLYALTKVSLPGDMLTKVDRMSMFHSLEVRVPLLDRPLMELLASIPVPLRFSRFRLKHLMRRVASRLLPAPVLAGRKRGFTVPLSKWLNQPAFESFVHDVISGESSSRGIIDPYGARALVQDVKRGNVTRTKELWTLVCFEAWRREHGPRF